MNTIVPGYAPPSCSFAAGEYFPHKPALFVTATTTIPLSATSTLTIGKQSGKFISTGTKRLPVSTRN